ncbi:MAG: MinD/ParA family protein [Dermatophilus congolensis]|nr:MinD/ParA family protein [Dermatophilus congolensis]
MNTASERTPTATTPTSATGSGPMLRPTLPIPRSGWRALAYRASGGSWNPGLSDKEQKRRDREAQIATQLRGKHVTAFFCLKGGISKTSTTAAVSTALANLRPDPVFAIDANPDAGDLAERLVGEQLAGITALSRHIDQVSSLEDLSRYTVTAGRLTVLPGEPNPVLGDSLSSNDFERILHTVQRFYSNVQVDCGTGVTHPLMSGILRYTSTAVIPAAWSVTGARRAMETIQWLRDNGFSHLADSCVVVLTAKDIVSKSVDKEAVQRHLASGSELFIVPADPHMADGGRFDWEQLKPRTQEAFLDIAEAVSRRFGRHDDEAQRWPLRQPSRGEARHARPAATVGATERATDRGAEAGRPRAHADADTRESTPAPAL